MTCVIIPSDVLRFLQGVKARPISINSDSRVGDRVRRVQRCQRAGQRGHNNVPAFEDRIIESGFCGRWAEIRYGTFGKR